MKVIGKTTRGASQFELGADTKRAARFSATRDVSIVKLTAYIDGLGSGRGEQALRGAIYTSTGALVALGDEVVVAGGSAASWVDLPFASLSGGALISSGDYDLGVLAGSSTQVARLYGDASVGASRANADTYSDGASDPFGTPTVLDFDLSIFATYITAWVTPDRPEAELARLPWREAQNVFLGAGGIAATSQQVTCGWYGTAFDDDRGAFALVARGGLLAGLVGKRLLLSSGLSRAAVYCKDSAVLNPGEDLAVPQRVYAALGLLSNVPTSLNVEVLG